MRTQPRTACLPVAVALALTMAAAPAAQAQTFALPANCTAFVTVQKRDCIVTHLFRCAGDPEGHQRRVDVDDSGMSYAGLIDGEAQWLESWHVLADSVETLRPGATDPASFSNLLDTGLDTFDFVTESTGGVQTRYTGFDRLTGESMVIDGVTLEATAFRVEARDPAGTVLWRTEGNEYINRDWRTFLSGIRTTTTPDDSWENDGTPVEFAFPGEDGFLTSSPRHGCGVVISRAEAALPDLTERF